MNKTNVFNFSPRFKGTSSEEPTLYELVKKHYYPWFSEDTAEKYVREYERQVEAFLSRTNNVTDFYSTG